jgi:ABC-2 type transport system permease protein
MNVLTITRKDLLQFVKDRGRLVMAFLLPLVFILAFGYAYSQLSSDSMRLVTLPVVNLDGEGGLGTSLLERLTPERGVKVVQYGEAEAQSLLEKGDIGGVLTIPAGVSQAVGAGEPVVLRLVSHPAANETDVAAVVAVVEGVAADMALQTQLISAFTRMGQMMAAQPQGAEAFTSHIIVKQAQSQFERAKTEPLISVEKEVPEAILARRAEAPNTMEIAVPGMAVLFLFLSASATGMAIYSEKKLGTFRRLLTAPLHRAEMLTGKLLAAVVVVLLQAVVIFAVGAWVMPLLGMDQIAVDNLPALAVVSLVVALCSTSLGVLLAAVCRTEGQISGMATAVLWIAGAVAGAFIPQFLLGNLLSTIGKLTPHYWAISAYSDVIVRGDGLAGIGTQLGILGLFTAVFFGVGVWRFRFDA